MDTLGIILMIFVLLCAVAVAFSKNLLQAIVIFMSESLAMSLIWILLESPDLAITEAAVGAGIDSVLMFVALKKIHAIGQTGVREQGSAVSGDRLAGSMLEIRDMKTEKEAAANGKEA